jgi:hypothetical protein
LFPWARFRKTKAAIKLHTQLDLNYDHKTPLDLGVTRLF